MDFFFPDSQAFPGGLLAAERGNILVDLSSWPVGNSVQPVAAL